MKWLFFSLIASMATVPAAWAQAPAAGDYEMLHGQSFLSVQTNKKGVVSFGINTIGANGHICSLQVKIKGSTGYVEENDKPCLISFEKASNGLTVKTSTVDACRNYCGVRAWFEGTYFLPPVLCTSKKRESIKKTFLSDYRFKKYARAYSTLNVMYSQCHDFLDWVEIDSVRNDLALTQFHLGHNDVCLNLLKDTVGATAGSEEALRSQLPPVDFDTYLPVARASWHNIKLCSGKIAEKKTAK
jgi:hypothetical protein